eukprot:13055312-Alexandrium_andersonii.AAC.1
MKTGEVVVRARDAGSLKGTLAATRSSWSSFWEMVRAESGRPALKGRGWPRLAMLELWPSIR